MAKRNDLKAKLRAADRRRRKREAASPSTVQTAPKPEKHSVDVAGLIANVVLEAADDPAQDVRDKIVVSALRATLKGLPASGEVSGPLSAQLEKIASEDGVSRRGFRDALSSMLELAADQQDPKDTQSFIRYLTLMAR